MTKPTVTNGMLEEKTSILGPHYRRMKKRNGWVQEGDLVVGRGDKIAGRPFCILAIAGDTWNTAGSEWKRFDGFVSGTSVDGGNKPAALLSVMIILSNNKPALREWAMNYAREHDVDSDTIVNKIETAALQLLDDDAPDNRKYGARLLGQIEVLPTNG